jgi:hypothetical protein
MNGSKGFKGIVRVKKGRYIKMDMHDLLSDPYHKVFFVEDQFIVVPMVYVF